MTITEPTPRAGSALDPEETMVGTSNGVGLWIAPAGTAAPEGLADFAAPWRPLGFASDDGVTLGGDTTSESFTPWQSTAPIRTIITEVTKTIGFTLWQLNQDTLGLYFDTVVPAPGTGGAMSFDLQSGGGGRTHAIGVDAKDGDNHLRFVFPRAQLDTAGDMVLQKGAMVPLEVTLSALDAGGILAHIDVKVAGGGGNGEVDPEVVRVTVPSGAAA